MTEPIVALEELSIELSNRCLCRCIHCSSGSQPKAHEDELTCKDHSRLIREARELGATVLSLSGGDPILHPNSVDYVYQARKLGYERALFYTTGIWEVDLEQLDMPGAEPLGALWGIDSWPLLDALDAAGKAWGEELDGPPSDILTVIFSLHSHRPEVHDYIMGISGAWYTITGGIMALVQDLGIDVEVHMVPMLPNYRHISEMRDLCEKMGVSKLSLLRFVPQTRGYANRSALAIGVNEFAWIQRKLNHELTTRANHPVKMRPGCPIDFRHTVGVVDEKPRACHAGLDLILVRPDGSVHPCAAWKTLPDDANVKDASLAEIWENAKVFQTLREYHRMGYTQVVVPVDASEEHLEEIRRSPCGSCRFYHSCKGGCPAQKLHAYGKNLDAMYDYRSDPLCPLGAE